MKPKEVWASERGEYSPLEQRVKRKVRWQFTIIVALTLGASLLLGTPSLEAAAPTTVPAVKKETVVFKACSREKNEKFKKKIEDDLRKSREWHQKMRENDLRKKSR